MEKLTFSKGDYIFKQGDKSTCAFIIESGKVEFFKETDKGSAHLTTSDQGDIFGEMGLIDEKPRSASAKAVSDVELTVISQDEFFDILYNDPEKGIKFLSVIFERLRQLTAKIEVDSLNSISKILFGRQNYKDTNIKLIPVTHYENVKLPKEGEILKRLPYRIGRQPFEIEKNTFDVNDLLLVDTEPFNVSKNHLAIDKEKNSYKIVDRGSFHGTIVNGETIGGRRNKGECYLKDGKNTMIIGKKDSPFVFDIIIE